MYSEIVNKQKRFFLEGATLDIKYRISILQKLKNSIIKNTTSIENALFNDFRKSQFEAYVAEVGMSINSINHAINNLKKWAKPKYVSGSILNYPSTEYYLAHPYGVCFIISPWNYPFLLTIDPLIACIAAGNCCIVKPSELTPCTSSVIEQILSEIFEDNYVKVMQGGADITDQLLKCQFDKIFFTGSPRVGKIVYKAAAELVVPVTLELGGKSPCIVAPSANLKLAAKRIIWGKLINAGQTCVAPDFLYVHESIFDKFSEMLIEAIEDFYGKDIEMNKDYPRIINQSNFDRLSALLNGGTILFGGKTNQESRYIEPTLIINVDWESEIMQDEIFGPILPIMKYNNLEDVVEILNDKPSPLAYYLFTENQKEKELVIAKSLCGGMSINDTISHILNPNLPFGGMGKSGIGNYHGLFGFQAFSHQKAIVERSSKFDIPIRYAPYSSKILKLIRLFFEKF